MVSYAHLRCYGAHGFRGPTVNHQCHYSTVPYSIINARWFIRKGLHGTIQLFEKREQNLDTSNGM